MADSKRVWREHKAAVWTGGAVVVVALTLAGGTVYALASDSGSAKPERCPTVLDGVDVDASNVVVSDSGEYVAASDGSKVVVWKGNKKATELDDVSGEVAAVNSDGTVVGEDDEGKPWVHDGEKRTDLLPPDDVDAENVFVADISDSGTIVGSVTEEVDESTPLKVDPVKWEDPAKPGALAKPDEEGKGNAMAITSEDVIVGKLSAEDAEDAGWYLSDDGEGEIQADPSNMGSPEISDAEGDWAVVTDAPSYYLVPITGSGDAVQIPLKDDSENPSDISVDKKGRAYGTNDDGKPVMVDDGDATKLPEVQGASGSSITGANTDGNVLAGVSEKDDESVPTVWRDCE